MNTIMTQKNAKTMMMVVLSSFLMAFALNNFVSPNQLLPGGFTGVSYLTTESLSKFFGVHIPISVFLLALNIPAALIAFRHVSARFTVFSLMHVFLLSFFITVVPRIIIVDDKLLGAIFGGVIYGFGNILVLKGGSSGGGTDFLVLAYSNRKGEEAWHYVLYFNATLIAVAGTLFGWERAMYAIIFQFVNTKIIEQMHTHYKRVALHIITSKGDAMSELLVKKTRHGVTITDGYGAFSKQEKQILFTVISIYEVDELVEEIKLIDPHVFVNITKSERIIGNYYTKPID